MVFPAASGGSGVRVRVLGIPVCFDPWFFIIGVLFTLRSGFDVVVLWLVVLGGSVLVHEMGHALLARTTGAQPEIVIHALGGLTSWVPPAEVSRARRIAISLAGPAAGIALGLVFLAAEAAGVGDSGGLPGLAILLGIRINILYGLFNLLPILPLDGGQTLRDLLPGNEERRSRTAAAVSVVVGAAVVVGALAMDEPLAAVFVAFFIVGNVVTLRGPRTRATKPTFGKPLEGVVRLLLARDYPAAAAEALAIAEAADRRGDHETAIGALQLAAAAKLDGGHPAEAMRLLMDLPPGSVDPLLEGRVLVANGHSELGQQRLGVAYATSMRDPSSAYRLANALVRAGSTEQVVRMFTSASDVAPAAVIAAARGAYDADGFAAAGTLAESAGRRATGADFALAAYTAARAWARAGERERALGALRAAVSADSRYVAEAAIEPAFSPLQGSEYDDIVRAR